MNVGDLIFYDDFVSNVRGWWSSSGSLAEGTAKEGKIENGEYQIVSHKQGYKWRVTCEACSQPDNVYTEATTRYVSGPTNYGYGLAVRGDRGMDQMYLFVIDELGSYAIGKVVNGQYTSVTDWTRNSLIHPGSPNRLGVLTAAVHSNSSSTGSL